MINLLIRFVRWRLSKRQVRFERKLVKSQKLLGDIETYGIQAKVHEAAKNAITSKATELLNEPGLHDKARQRLAKFAGVARRLKP